MNSITNAIEKFLDESMEIIKTNIDQSGQNASGETKGSLRVDMLNENRGQLSGAKHIYVLETGRKPGKMPPVQKIIDWAKIRGFENAKGAGYAISKRIAEEGTKLYREGGRKDIITPIFEKKRMDELSKEIANVSIKEVDNVLAN